MTNTGDFRRYSYSSDASYALKAFDVGRSSTVPAYEPEEKRDIKVRQNPKRKSKSQLIREQRLSFRAIVMIVFVSLLTIGMLFGVLHTYAKKNEITHEISNLENQLAIAQSENTRINSELNALVSVSMIDKYAVEELGMTKVQSGQIRYIDVQKYKEEHQAAAVQIMEKIAQDSR